jgi:hypothetical protein
VQPAANCFAAPFPISTTYRGPLPHALPHGVTMTDLKRFRRISTSTVDKVVNNPHLTAENAFNGGHSIKLPNRQANFSLNKIKDLRRPSYGTPGFLMSLEKYFRANTNGGQRYRHGIFDKTAHEE